MKKILTVFLFNFLSHISFSQGGVIELNLLQKKVNDIQTLSLGDSLFVAVDWFDSNQNLVIKKGFWVSSQTNEITNYDFGFIQKGVLCALEKVDDSFYYYFVDYSGKNKDFVKINIVKTNRESKQAFIIRREPIIFNGEFLGSDYSKGKLRLFAFDQKSQSVLIKTVQEGLTINDKRVQLPFVIKKELIFFDKNRLLSVEEGTIKNKLYFENGELILLSDESIIETIVYSLNIETQESKTIKIPTLTNKMLKKTNSFLYENLIYKVTVPAHDFELKIYHLSSGKEIYKKSFPRLEEFRSMLVYQRDDKLVQVSKSKSLYTLLNGLSNTTTSMFVESFNEKKSIVLLGTYLEDQGTGLYILNPSNLALSIVSSMIATTLMHTLGKAAGLSKYCYLVGDTSIGFQLKTEFKSEIPKRQLIDEYEQLLWECDLKKYQPLSSGIYGIYHMKKQDKLRIVKF